MIYTLPLNIVSKDYSLTNCKYVYVGLLWLGLQQLIHCGQEDYAVEVKNVFQALAEAEDLEAEWTILEYDYPRDEEKQL